MSSESTSLLKRKLLIYFLLVTIVSVSVSAEIILELSSSKLKIEIAHTIAKQGNFNPMQVDLPQAFKPLVAFQYRMLILLALIVGVIVGALALFLRDVAKPMDALVAGAKKVADGDFSVTIETHSNDEIEEVAQLINQMNSNTQELVVQVRNEVENLSSKISHTQQQIGAIMQRDGIRQAMNKKNIGSKDLQIIFNAMNDLGVTFDQLKDDMAQMSELVSMYKVYDSFGDSYKEEESIAHNETIH